jgi:rod shape-determining protein MreC
MQRVERSNSQSMIRRSNTTALQGFAPRGIGAKMLTFSVVAGVFALLLMGRTHPEQAGRLRAQAADVVAPVVGFVQSPAQGVSRAWQGVQEFFGARSELEALRLENQQLLKWQAEALKLKTENQEMRELLRMVPPKVARYVSASLVGDAGGQYTQSALINAGSVQGVKAQQAVVGARGMVGYVTEAGDSSARVILLSDINARVAIVGERSGKKAIVAGDGAGSVKLLYVGHADRFISGERLLTSGDGGFFPEGIPVARLQDDGADTLIATPFADGASERIVSVLDYTF